MERANVLRPLLTMNIIIYKNCVCTTVSSGRTRPLEVRVPLWCNTYLAPLFLVQRKVLRSISFQPFFSSSTTIFHSLKILKLNDMITHEILKFVYKYLNSLSPSHFLNYFQLTTNVHSHETRQAAGGDIFQSIRNIFLYGLRSIKYFGA